MNNNPVIIPVIIMLSILVFGCSGSNKANLMNDNSLLDRNWGKSYQQAKTQQILYPERHKNLSPVEGLNGNAGNTINNEYIKSFQKGSGQQQFRLDIPLAPKP